MYILGIINERISAIQIGMAKIRSMIFTQLRYNDRAAETVPVD